MYKIGSSTYLILITGFVFIWTVCFGIVVSIFVLLANGVDQSIIEINQYSNKKMSSLQFVFSQPIDFVARLISCHLANQLITYNRREQS
jgi:cell shape-determining protein MreC